jgi:hypothetical protein
MSEFRGTNFGCSLFKQLKLFRIPNILLVLALVVLPSFLQQMRCGEQDYVQSPNAAKEVSCLRCAKKCARAKVRVEKNFDTGQPPTFRSHNELALVGSGQP